LPFETDGDNELTARSISVWELRLKYGV